MNVSYLSIRRTANQESLAEFGIVTFADGHGLRNPVIQIPSAHREAEDVRSLPRYPSVRRMGWHSRAQESLSRC